MKKLVLLFIISFLTFAQGYQTIETPNVRVVFEEGLEKEAKETANYIDNLKDFYLKDGFKGDLKQIPIILKKGNNISNAFFTGTPNKLEYITISPISSELGVTPWLMDLSIHEYRHFMQYQLVKENRYTKIAYILGGDMATQILGAATIPQWVWEGEATYYETKLSNNGRGRTPNFLKDYRMLFNDGEIFSYEKAKNSSYKDIVPSHYHLGYLLVNYGYEKYGEKFWEDAITKGAIGEGYLPFSKYIEKKTGLSSTKFYKEAMNYYKNYFKEEKTVEYTTVLDEPKTPTMNTFAYQWGDKLVSLISDYDNAKAFYEINGNTKRKITDLGLMYDEYFDLKGDKILWSEIEPNLTKGDINYYNIKLYDLKKNKKIDITKKTYYQSPALSNSGRDIAAINHNGLQSTTIHILDTEGNLLKELANNKSYFYNYIKWSKDDKTLIASLRDSKGKMALAEIDITTGEETLLIPFDDYIIGTPFVYGDEIYFDGSFNMIENIYKIDKSSKKISQITQSSINAKYPTVVNNRLYFSEYEKKGYLLKSTDNLVGKEFFIQTLTNDKKMNTESLKNPKFNIVDTELNENYEIKNYNYLKHLIKIHSWSYSLFPGIDSLSLTSTNELQDLNMTGSYTSDSTNDVDNLNFSAQYSRYWPIINVQVTNENNKGVKSNLREIEAEFPFYLSKNQFNRKFVLDLAYLTNEEKTTENLVKITGTFANSQYKGYRDIKTPFGQQFAIEYLWNIDNSENKRLALDGTFINKGLFENHSITYNLAYEKNYGKLNLDDKNLMSRAYKTRTYDYALINSLDYDFPIAYPDFGGKGYYLKRLSGNFFYDNTSLNGQDKYESFGGSVDFDNILLALVPITVRVQYSHLLQDKEDKVEVGIKLEM